MVGEPLTNFVVLIRVWRESADRLEFEGLGAGFELVDGGCAEEVDFVERPLEKVGNEVADGVVGKALGANLFHQL